MNIMLAAQLDRGQVRGSPIAGCDPERDEKFDGYGQLSQSGSYEQLMQLRQQSATTNLIGANISEALDEGHRAKPWVGDGGGAAGSEGGGECVLAGEYKMSAAALINDQEVGLSVAIPFSIHF